MSAEYLSEVDFSIEFHDGRINTLSRHFHPFYEFYFLCKGKVDYLVDGSIYSVREGDVVVIPPNTLHKSIALNNSARKRILLYLNQNCLGGEFLKYQAFLSSGVFHLGSNDGVKTILMCLLSEFENEKSELMIKSLLHVFLTLLTRCQDVEREDVKNTRVNDAIQKVINYIHNEYSANITLSSAAAFSFMNEAYLSRVFKKQTGFTFSEYLNKHRIQMSIKLLENTSKNISEIAAEVGFNSLNHFCKTFKNHIGCSPLNYRKHLIG